MKNKAGIVIGFIFGLAGFLLVFKLFFLEHIPREDEVPPGLVVIAAALNGVLFAYISRSLQNNFRNKNSNV
jgi:hypothetical protein